MEVPNNGQETQARQALIPPPESCARDRDQLPGVSGMGGGLQKAPSSLNF